MGELQSSFQMTIKSDYTIVIAELSDWLKDLAPVKTSQKQN